MFESVGERALGMAGAFVAVANDSTAVHWNPAGLVHGGPAGMTIGWDRFHFGNSDLPAVAGPEPLLLDVVHQPRQLARRGVSFGRFESTSLIGASDGALLTQRLRVNQ